MHHYIGNTDKTIHTSVVISLFFVFCCNRYFALACSVLEESKMATQVCNISDILSLVPSSSGKPTFSLVDGIEYFKIDKLTGILRVNGRINREDICPNSVKDSTRLPQDCYLKITVAYLQESPTKYQFHHVSVIIKDKNDNAPYFEAPYIKIEIPENSSPQKYYELKRAVDIDEGINGRISYYIEGSSKSLFSLEDVSNSQSLKLTISRPFDREKEETYNLFVVAIDGGKPPNSATMTVQIDITNVNDHRPEFPRTYYLEHVPENTQINTILLSVAAKDRDITDQINYKINDNTDLETKRTFQVTRSGDVLLTKQLDYETIKEYKIPIIAQDNGYPSLSSSTTITIKVQDVNDHQPRVTIRSLREDKKLLVSENEKPSTFVAMVTASDGDEGQNGDIECSLKTNWNFRLEPYSILSKIKQYTLVTETEFDREITNQYNLEITCSDKGDPQQKKSVFFTVYIGDVNDSGPRFHKSTINSEVKENQKAGIQILQLQANDPDEGPNKKTLYFLDPKFEHLFRIDEKSGNVFTKQTFDREVNQTIYFRAIAVDAQDKSMNATVTVLVRIIDVNDCPPIFLQNYTFYVAENQLNARAGKLEATDADEGKNSQLRFSLKDTKHKHLWRISQNGILKVAQGQRLDRENLADYFLTIVANDGGLPSLSSSTLVHIIVTDSNDHGPRFIFPSDYNNSVNVSSQVRPGLVIATIKAIDRDVGVNSRIEYSLGYAQHTKTPFHLDNITGELSLSESVPVDTHRIYRLIVTATDGGKPKQRGSAVLVINFDSGRTQEPALPPGEANLSHRLSRNLLIAFGIGLAILVLCCLVLLLSYFCYYIQVHKSPTPLRRNKDNCFSAIFSGHYSSDDKSKNEEGTLGEKHGLALESTGIYQEQKEYRGHMAEMKIGTRPVTHRDNISELEATLYTKLDPNGDDFGQDITPYGQLTRTMSKNPYWMYAPEPDRGHIYKEQSSPSTDPTRRKLRRETTESPQTLEATLSTSSEEMKRILTLGHPHLIQSGSGMPLLSMGGEIRLTDSDYALVRGSDRSESSSQKGAPPVFQTEYSTLTETNKTIKGMSPHQAGYVYGSPYMTSSFV